MKKGQQVQMHIRMRQTEQKIRCRLHVIMFA
jgi:hypothetical protein